MPETVPVEGAGEPDPVGPPVGLGKAVELVCGYGAELCVVFGGDPELPVPGRVVSDGMFVPVEPPVGLGKAVELVCGYGAELWVVFSGNPELPVPGRVDPDGTTPPLVQVPDVLGAVPLFVTGDVPVGPLKEVVFVTG